MSKTIIIIGAGPVSYTHLDVYKRQGYGSMRVKINRNLQEV